MRVLVVKTSSMGDVLHTLPALTDAMHAIPDIHFDWVVEEGFAQIPEWHPAVNQVLPVAIRRWRKHWFGPRQREERVAFKRDLQSHTYDAIIDAQGLVKSAALITRLAKGVKHGLDRRSAREPLATWWYDHRHFIDKKQHAVERVRELFSVSLGYTKPEHPGDYAIASHFLARQQSSHNHYYVFLHSTTRDNKHWSEQSWRELIALCADAGINIKLPWGTESERQRALRLAETFPCVEVLPKLSLSEIAQVLAEARAIVSVDTGLSHLTAALDRPNITLYGPTDPGLIGGYGKNQVALRPASGNQMSDIQANHVYELLRKSG